MLEFIHNYTNNHPLISIFVVLILIGIIFLLYAIETAEEINEETEKAMKIAILKDYFKNEKLNYEKVLMTFSLPNENVKLLIENWTGILMTDEEILKVKRMLNNI